MSAEVIASFISLGGAVISVVVSLLVSSRQTKAELEKLRIEIRQNYANKLLDKRLETYPQLYAYLSELMKNISKTKKVFKNDLEKFCENVEDWDSKYSIFSTASTGATIHQFRRMIRELAKMSEENLQKKFDSYEEIKKLRASIGELEISLKSDIGIYMVEFENINKKFSSYKELSEVRKTSES